MNYRTKHIVVVAAVLAALALQPVMAQVKDHTKIKFPALPEFKVESPEVYTLENGMKIFLLEDHELPLISVDARIRTGSNYEPSDKSGLASITGTVQRTGGTEKMTGDEIDDYLADRAAFVETGIGGDSGFAAMNTLKDDFDGVFAVFADVLRHPVFDEEMIDVAKSQTRAGIARRNDSITGIIGREFDRLVYGADSPLVQMTEYATLAAITRDDLVAWHEKYYHPNNIYLGVVGDFDTVKMKAAIEEKFGDWSKGASADTSAVAHRTEPIPGVFFIEKTDVTQANISMGHLGIKRDNPDYFAVRVLNEIMAGGFSGRLMNNIRTEKGLAYSVFGGIGSSWDHLGVFEIGLQTKSSTMGEAVDALREEVVDMIENPPTDEEIQGAKEGILNSFIFNYDSKGEILNQQMLYAYYGLPTDYLEKYRSNIEKVGKDDLASVAKKYLHPEQLTILVVGKPDDFDRPLDSFGKVTTVDITIPPPPDTTPEVARTAETLEQGSKIFARMAGVLGGSNPEGVSAIQTSGNVALSIQGQSMSLDQTVLTVFPDKVRQVIKTPMGEQAIVISGAQGFMTMGGQVQDLPASRVEEANRDFGREIEFLTRYQNDPEIEAVAAGSEEIEGATCDIIAVTYKGAESRLCVDADGRVLKQSYQGNHPFTQTPGMVEMYFSDYRETEGRMVPYKQTMRIEGEEIMNMRLDTIVINPEVDPSLFEKPEA